MAKFYSGSIQKGSKGDDTKKWQEFLNTQGYGLSVDGDFGDVTYNATVDWQKNNGLTADGIVGEQTWGKAGYSNINNPISAPEVKPFEYEDYTEGSSVVDAGKKKTDAENAVNNYGDFSYSKTDDFQAIIDKILNREKFSYDLNGDALYQQYKDKYIQQGKMAMQDTMGQAAAMTGGYGNSYAASVGNQAYQAQLNNLNDVIPELYQMAYDKYNQEGQDMYNQYSMLADDRNTEYGMWADKRNQLLTDRDYYENAYNNERNYDYGKYTDDKTFAYGTHRDSVEDAQWNAEFDEALRQHEQSMALTKEQWEYTKAQAQNSSSGSGSGSGNGSGNGGKTEEDTSVSGVSQSIIDKTSGLTTNSAKADYLAGLVNDGIITKEQAAEVLAKNQNTEKDLKDRTWSVASKGGGNLWGIDQNAEVKDQYGNKYRLDDLVDKLVKEGMSKKEAKSYVKKLQQDLGISSNWLFGL